MNYYYDGILRAVGYIENHLLEDMKLSDISSIAGFSQFHFMRLFKSLSGHTLNTYITRRKITQAAQLLLQSDMRIIDIAFLFGYNSQEAFTRAFKEVYNITPNAYRKNGFEYKNLEQLVLNESMLTIKNSSLPIIEPQIVYKDSFYIAGIQYIGNNKHYDIPKLWNTLESETQNIKAIKKYDICYGLETYNENFKKTGVFEYVAGVEVTNTQALPTHITVRKVDKHKYAVFPISSVIENISKHIHAIYAYHLPNSGLKLVGNYDFEYYDCEYTPNDATSRLYFYIPVE
jgi:AraC family transcriptional regulator